MSRARTITREDLIRRYAAAIECLTNDELRDVVETVEDRLPGKRPRWRAGQTTTAPVGEVR